MVFWLLGVVIIDGEIYCVVKFFRKDVCCGRKSCYLCKVNKCRIERGFKVEIILNVMFVICCFVIFFCEFVLLFFINW